MMRTSDLQLGGELGTLFQCGAWFCEERREVSRILCAASCGTRSSRHATNLPALAWWRCASAFVNSQHSLSQGFENEVGVPGLRGKNLDIDIDVDTDIDVDVADVDVDRT